MSTAIQRHATFVAREATSVLKDGSVTFDVRPDGADGAYATYSHREVDATLRAFTDTDTDPEGNRLGYHVAIVDRTEGRDVQVEEFLTTSHDAAAVLALAAAMVRAPRGMVAWAETKEIDLRHDTERAAWLFIDAAPDAVLREASRVDDERETHAYGIPVVFDVVAKSRAAAARAVVATLPDMRVEDPARPGEVESWWLPEVEDRTVEPNDNDPMRLVPADPNPLDVVAALDVAILWLNTLEAPDATTASDYATMEDRADAALATLNTLRDAYRRA